jgi:predicted nucleic acid-binding Zn ribbon protein
MSDRRLWLQEPCLTCGARSGLRCQTSRYGGKPTRFLQKFEELLSAQRQLYRPPGTPAGLRTGDTSRASATRPHRGSSPAGAREASPWCERCGEPLPAGLRAEARYCSKRCRQAASRARLKDRPPSPPPSPAETCAWCAEPMPAGARAEARFCSKRCRQAASRHALRIRPSSPNTSGRTARPALGAPRRRGSSTLGSSAWRWAT